MIWRVETFPVFFRLLAFSFPLTYANRAARGLVLKGEALWINWPDLLALVGFLGLFLLGMLLFVRSRQAV